MARRDAVLKILKSQPLLLLSKRLKSGEPFNDLLKVRSNNDNRISCSGTRLASSVVEVVSERDFEEQQGAARPVRIIRHQQPSTPKLLIGKVCQVLRDTKWGQGTVEALQDLGIYFTPSLVNEVLRCQQDVDTALGFFEHVRKQPYYKHNSRTLAKMLTLLGGARRYDEVHKLVESMQKDRIQLDTELFNTLIHIYGDANMTEKALATLAAFRKGGGKLTAYTYGSMIQMFMKLGDVQNGMAMYQQMLEARYLPDHTTFNIVIDSLAKADQVRFCTTTSSSSCLDNQMLKGFLLNFRTVFGWDT